MDKEVIDQLKQVQLQILDDFVRVCEKNGLRYCLCGGTCIGAVRHKGFIPWDDDIDVKMPRADFEEFVRLTSKEKRKDFFLDYHTTNSTYGHNFAKYCKNNTVFIEPNGLKQAIYIDVFAQDKVPGPEYTAKSPVPRMIHKLDALLTVRREGLRGRDFKTKIIFFVTRWIPAKTLFKWEHRLMTRFEYSDVEYYVNYGSRYSFVMETIPIIEFEPYAQKEFEGKMYNVPRNWHLYLSRIYGDYMTLPPVEKRVTHYPQYISFDTTIDDVFNK